MGAWKVGRNFEDIIDQTEAQLMQQAQLVLQAGPQPSENERIAMQKMQTELAKERLKQEGKLADIQAKERTSANKVAQETEGSENRSQAKKEQAILDSHIRTAEKIIEMSNNEL